MKKPSLTTQIGIALLLAVVTGILLSGHADFVNGYIKPIGVIFLNLLKFIVVPLVLFSIMAGILSMNDIKKVGHLGLRALAYFMVTTLFAVTLGLVIPSLVKGFMPLIKIDLGTTVEIAKIPNCRHVPRQRHHSHQLYGHDASHRHCPPLRHRHGAYRRQGRGGA